MSNIEAMLTNVRFLINQGKYEKDIEEPTPLEEKCKLVTEVKELFLADLSNLGISSTTSNLAWDITEDVTGADEALNKGFLYQVLTYIEILVRYVRDLEESNINNSTSLSWKSKTYMGDNLSELF